MKKKITLIILSSILISYLMLIVFSSLNIRDIGMKSAEDKARISAELVKDGLTAHMINGIMNTREYFLKSIENSKNIKSLWITRSQSVISQFGAGYNNEIPRDDIDREVIKTGESYKKLYESTDEAYLRFTIPYTASQYGNPNCMSCHDAKEGDVLGTVSMVIDVTDIRERGVNTSIIIFSLAIVMSLIVFVIIQNSMTPILDLFESIKFVMNRSQEGDYSQRVETKQKGQEFQNVKNQINSFLDKIQATLSQIEKTVGEFLTKSHTKNNDILIELSSLVEEIAALHKFKKTIEFDEDKAQIYTRIGILLEKIFGLNDFVIVELDSKKSTIVYSTFNQEMTINFNCRAFRTKQAVSSNQFYHICEDCNKKFEHYFCVPYTISDNLELMIHVGTKEKKNVETLKSNLSKITDYINEARPEIVSKNLTEILKVSSTTDPLTDLYNRKYLDEFIEKSIAQAKRTNATYGVLMIDIDYFKMVNDTYGHDVGDIVIKTLAKVLKTSIREADFAFRYGGEEFLVLLYNCSPQAIEEIAQKIRISFGEITLQANDGKSFKKTLSIGSALFPNDSESIWKVIKFADIALYKAKESGRNRVVSFDTSLIEGTELESKF